MAEFSKQWLEFNEEFTDGWDFDIEEIASSIQNNHHIRYICEGFGFVAIGKNDIGETILAYRDFENDIDNVIEWKTLSEVINKQK